MSHYLFVLLKPGYSQPGNIDSSFGKNGIVTANLGSPVNYTTIGSQVLVMTDGSFYAIIKEHYQYVITKRFSNGSLDSTYGNHGFVPIKYGLAKLQTDGKIVLAGLEDNFSLTRYNTDGSIDKTFNNNGIQTSDNYVLSICIQNDGKIIAAGSAVINGHRHFVTVRYNKDGSSDKTFNKDGMQITGFGTSDDAIISAFVQPDGKILVGGNSTNYVTSQRYIVVARYNTDGSPDTTFSSDGKHAIDSAFDISYDNTVNSMTFQSNGKVVILRYTEENTIIARYNINKGLDKTFNGNGQLYTDFSLYDNINSLAIQNDGKIVVAGTLALPAYNSKFTIVRYNTNGSIDSTFNGTGKQTSSFGSYAENSSSVTIQSNGKIFQTGFTVADSATQKEAFAIIKYKNNGTPDSAFGSNGKLVDYYKMGSTNYAGSLVQKDGKIVTGGNIWNGINYDFVIARYNVNGSLDKTFNNAGYQAIDFGSADNLSSIAIQSDGKIVAAGYTGNNNSYRFAITRVNTNGSIDSTFNHTGKRVSRFSNTSSDMAYSAAIQSDGKIVVAGRSGSKLSYYPYDYNADFALIRYNKDGSLDSSFSQDGLITTDAGGYGDIATSVLIQPDGKILAGGSSQQAYENKYDYPYFAVIRYKTDGTLDSSFAENGKQLAAKGVQDYSYIKGIAQQKDGKIVAAGISNDLNNDKYSGFTVARFNVDGSLDNTFNGNGVKTTSLTDTAKTANAVAIQSDGKIIVGGGLNGNFSLLRFNTDGSADNSFGTNGIQTTPVSTNYNEIQSIALADDKLYAAGFGLIPENTGMLVRYLLSPNKAPTVSITSPANNAVYSTPATITVNATASDSDGTVVSVKFYNGTTYLKTDFTSPYSYTISNLPASTYSLTAKATDNAGAQTVSAPVKVIVNKAPVVSITSPANNATFTTPANVTVNAAASDSDGTVYSVKFYNGSTYLKTDFTSPYSYTISNLPAGTYSLTVKATDNNGAETVSVPVKVKVANAAVVAGKPYSENEKTALNNALSFRVSPNPATNIVNISASGLQLNKPATLSIISISGIVLKTMQIRNASTQLDVSALASGVYTIKIINGDKVIYKQFMKL